MAAIIEREARRITTEPDYDPQHFVRKVHDALTRVAKEAYTRGHDDGYMAGQVRA